MIDHAETILDLPSAYLAEIGPALKLIARSTGVQEFNILQNNGKLAFQVRLLLTLALRAHAN